MKKLLPAIAITWFLACTLTHAQPVSHIKVENIALKKVEVDGMMGKSERFRYFFRITNSGAEAFNGRVEIGLHNVGVNDEVTKETFPIDIAAGAAKVVHVDSRTGPRKYHGDFSIKGFVYSLDRGGKATGATLEEAK